MLLAITGENVYNAPIKWGSGSVVLEGVLSGVMGKTDEVHSDPHSGSDYEFGHGAQVPPVAVGSCVFTSTPNSPWGTVFGFSCIIDHGDGTRALYAHFASLSVAVGDVVDFDTILGVQGSTGISTDDHVHLGLTTNANPWFNKDADGGVSRLLDPMAFTAQASTAPSARETAAHAAQYLSESVDRLRRMLEAGVPAFALAAETANAEALLASLRVQMDALA